MSRKTEQHMMKRQKKSEEEKRDGKREAGDWGICVLGSTPISNSNNFKGWRGAGSQDQADGRAHAQTQTGAF